MAGAHYRARCPDGSEVVLDRLDERDLTCLQRRQDSVQAALAAAGIPVRSRPRPDTLGPVWVVRTERCRVGTCNGCGCGVVDLVEALALLPTRARSGAVEAHLTQVDVLERHLCAAVDLCSGADSDEPVCAGCVLDLPSHLDELEQEVTRRCLMLAEALRVFRVVVHLEERTT